MPHTIIKRYGFLLCIIFLSSMGCSLLQDKEQIKKRKEEMARKKENYAALYERVSASSLKKGTDSHTIRASYGDPDDIFSSSSDVSRLEIWTYENVEVPEEKQEKYPVRLYFNNNKLIRWQN